MSGPGAGLRLATLADAAQVQGIYAPIVRDTFISFEVDVPGVAEMERRIRAALDRHAWLAFEDSDGIAGYAYATKHRERRAYQWSVDVSCYVHARARRRGIASRLYEALFRVLVLQGFTNAFAGIALPNAASVGMHESVGFTTVGVYANAGFKCGEWHDVLWMQRVLASPGTDPQEPLPLAAFSPRALQAAFIGP